MSGVGLIHALRDPYGFPRPFFPLGRGKWKTEAQRRNGIFPSRQITSLSSLQLGSPGGVACVRVAKVLLAAVTPHKLGATGKARKSCEGREEGRGGVRLSDSASWR